MTFSNAPRCYFGEHDRQCLSASARPQRLLGGAALACVTLACAFALWADLVGGRTYRLAPAQPNPLAVADAYARLSAALNNYAELSAALKSYAGRLVATDKYARLFDSRFMGFPPGTFLNDGTILDADSGPITPGPSISRQTRQMASLPPTRRDRVARRASAPTRLHPSLRTTSLAAAAPTDRAVANTSAETPSIFEKLFGKVSSLVLAYASPDDGGLGGGQSVLPGRYDRWTAVYDISAHAVYLPDGTKLEAHSGLGRRRDNPRSAGEKNRGVTPPDVYDLVMRKRPFHGVQALRLIPVDERKVLGRTGLLAHTYMLGPRGDSNGCVSFKNYKAFLQAYLDHRIKRLAVVTRLD